MHVCLFHNVFLLLLVISTLACFYILLGYLSFNKIKSLDDDSHS